MKFKIDNKTFIYLGTLCHAYKNQNFFFKQVRLDEFLINLLMYFFTQTLIDIFADVVKYNLIF